MNNKHPTLRVLSYVMMLCYVAAMFCAVAVLFSLFQYKDWGTAEQESAVLIGGISVGGFIAGWLIDQYGRSQSGGRAGWWRDY